MMHLFVMEAHKGDGDRYLTATLRNMLSGLNHEMQKKADFSKANSRLRELHLTLHSVSSELHCSGDGVTRNSARVISLEDENTFWEKGALETSSPTILQHSFF